MISKIYTEPNYEAFKKLSLRPKKNEEDLSVLISAIFSNVEENGDTALLKLTKEYDKVDICSIEVSKNEIEDARNVIPPDLKKAILVAKENIIKFHQQQVTDEIVIETTEGVICKQKSVGIERVGIYIPGGTAPLFSTVLMLAIPAVLAGCREIILCTPPNAQGKIDPAILYTADLCGLTKIYQVGGAQAIAAMAIGTECIPSVSKVFGPGNQYVTAAKQYAARYGVAMDSPAGPSELLVYANKTSDPAFVASDLLSQAEHGDDSQVILVASNEEVVENVNAEIKRQVKVLPRKEIAISAIQNSKAIIIENIPKAFDFINEYGPEHLILAFDDYDAYIERIVNAGSVFLGQYCPESAGDYASGTNHTLPTDGWVKSYSGTNINSFTRKITFQEISKTGILNLGETIMKMAEHEGLEAHRKAVEVRLNRLNKND